MIKGKDLKMSLQNCKHPGKNKKQEDQTWRTGSPSTLFFVFQVVMAPQDPSEIHMNVRMDFLIL